MSDEGTQQAAAKAVSAAIEEAAADAFRQGGLKAIELMMFEIGEALERVKSTIGSPVSRPGMFKEPLKTDDPISRLGLPRGMTRQLKNEGGFETVGQMATARDAELKVPGIGPVKLAKIDARLDDAGHPRTMRGQ